MSRRIKVRANVLPHSADHGSAADAVKRLDRVLETCERGSSAARHDVEARVSFAELTVLTARRLRQPTAVEVLIAMGTRPPYLRCEVVKVGIALARAGYRPRQRRERGVRVRRYERRGRATP